MNKLFFFSLFAVSGTAFSQAYVREGTLDSLKGVQSIRLEFRYDKNKIGNLSEREFIDKKKAKYNASKPGKGDQWERDWLGAREKSYEPRFREAFKRTTGMALVPGAPYKLIFFTSFVDAGFSGFVVGKKAYVAGLAVIVRSENPDRAIAVLAVTAHAHSGLDFGYADRLEEAYATAAAYIGRCIVKGGKK